MPRDSSATKARIIEAAFREFAAHGLAGARVDRIAANAQANKRAIYDYFGDKEQLFDKILIDMVARGTDDVPPLWDDLPEYAGRIYDYFVADPDRMRIHLWRQLERPQALGGETDAYRQIIDGLRAAQPAGARWKPAQLFALLWALQFTWFLASPALAELPDARTTAKTAHKARRAATVEAVRLLIVD
jgi:AcrR family transcriptional regulator